jgi:3-hydroxyacyl-CoA dehydrogenase
MELVEEAARPASSAATIDRASKVACVLGKTAILVNSRPAFVTSGEVCPALLLVQCVTLAGSAGGGPGFEHGV